MLLTDGLFGYWQVDLQHRAAEPAPTPYQLVGGGIRDLESQISEMIGEMVQKVHYPPSSDGGTLLTSIWYEGSNLHHSMSRRETKGIPQKTL